MCQARRLCSRVAIGAHGRQLQCNAVLMAHMNLESQRLACRICRLLCYSCIYMTKVPIS